MRVYLVEFEDYLAKLTTKVDVTNMTEEDEKKFMLLAETNHLVFTFEQYQEIVNLDQIDMGDHFILIK